MPRRRAESGFRSRPVEEQRAIADHLDAETARIDALITKRQRQIDLLEEHLEAAIYDLIDWSGRSQTLRQAGTSVLTGPFGTQLAASEYVDDGVPVINPSHIDGGQIQPERGVSVPAQTASDGLQRHRLRAGDLVMGRKGDVGRSALIRAAEDGYVCGSDSIAVRCNPGALAAAYLAELLHLSIVRQHLESQSRGATMASVNEGTLLALRVPVPSLQKQAEICSTCKRLRSESMQLRHALTRQIELLRERRQALITAAVTGELAVA